MKILISFISFCLALNVALAQDQQSLLWEVTSPEGKKSYLFGTYHLIGSDYLNEQEHVQRAFKSATDVVVETEIDSSQLMSLAMMAIMNDKTLRDFYDSTEYHQVDQVVTEEIGIGLQQLEVMKPISIAMMLSLAQAQEQMAGMGMTYPGQPLDLYFAQTGRKSGKTVHSLESMQEQMKLLYDSDPLEEQADMLLEMVNEQEMAEEYNEELLKAYKDQDLEAMWTLAQDLGETYGDMSVLVDNRNVAWVSKLDPILRKENAFVAVGALHLPGENGLIRLLQREGYELIPVRN